MKTPQLLQLIEKGTRFTPAIYRFGASETLNVYHDGRVDICDARTGYIVRKIDYDWLRDWGYSPAKLLAGDETDQFINNGPTTSISEIVADAVRGVLFTAALGACLVFIGNISGCSDYVYAQLDKDIATTTVHPVEGYYDRVALAEAR